MSDTKSSNAHHAKPAKVWLPKEPVVNAQGIKIYPNSFTPVKAQIDPSRIPNALLTGFQIEFIHVVIFLGITWMLFYSNWKKPNVR
jgi:hypothetical protein